METREQHEVKKAERYHFIEWGTGDILETAKNNGY